MTTKREVKAKVKYVAKHVIPDFLEFGEVEGISQQEKIINMYTDVFPKSIGLRIGRIDEKGNKISFLKKDRDKGENENALFCRALSDMVLASKKANIIDKETDDIVDVTDYYIQYYSPEHSSFKETVKDYVCRCSNVNYTIAYEVLFVQDEMERSLVLEYKTSGHYATSFYSHMENLEDEIISLTKANKLGFSKDEDDDGLLVLFYDEFGQSYDLHFFSIRELLASIASIRVIKLEKEIKED